MAFPAVRRRPGVGLILAVVALAAAVGLALGVSAFTADRSKTGSAPGPKPAAGASSGPSAAATTPTIPAVKVTAVGLVKGFQQWSKPLTLHIKNGTLLAVRAVDGTGVVLPGTTAKTSWVSTGQVIPSRTYQVQAQVKGLDGITAYHTLSVTSTAPDSTVNVKVNLQQGPAVGVGWPITVHFTKPVANRAAVEKALVIQTSVPVIGAWHWFSDTEVHYRPEVYWPAHTTITLHRDLDGVQVAPGVWGVSDQDAQFTVGDAHISTVDAGVHGQHMTVTVNGQQIGDYKVSTGRPALPTLGGVHIVLEKFAVKEMKSWTLKPPIPQFLNGKKNPAAYDEKELWATRISNAGAFIHYNPLTLKVQGTAAASHGCVNTGLQEAQTFYNLSLPGDVVKVINSPAAPNVNDPGMQDWNFSWAAWTAGSALSS